jgi:hypothetical protein
MTNKLSLLGLLSLGWPAAQPAQQLPKPKLTPNGPKQTQKQKQRLQCEKQSMPARLIGVGAEVYTHGETDRGFRGLT